MTSRRVGPIPALFVAPLVLLAGASASAVTASREAADLVVLHAKVVTVDANFNVIDDGAIAVRGGKILAVGASAGVVARFRAKETIDAHGGIVMPGLVNLHNHAAMSLLRGGADDRKLMDWLENFIFPAEAKNVTPEFVRWGTLLSCLEMISSGTTTFTDMYYFEDEVARAVDQSGMRGVLGETVIGFPVPDAATPEKGLDAARAFIAKWKGHPRIVPAVAPHAPYTVSAEMLQASAALSAETGTPWLIHLSETLTENRTIRDAHAMSPVAWLHSLGVLSKHTVAAHCVWLTDEDIRTLKDDGCGCAHNPESNMKLASGTAPVKEMLAAGLPVGLGTDGPASNNDLDQFQSMDFASKLGKLASSDPSALPARAVVVMATRRGAEILGLGDRIGSLEVGKEADFILIDTDSPKATPMYDAASHIVSVLKGSDVRAVWVAGRLLYRDGKFLTLDRKEIQRHARELQAKVVASLREIPSAAPKSAEAPPSK